MHCFELMEAARWSWQKPIAAEDNLSYIYTLAVHETIGFFCLLQLDFGV